MRKVYVVSTLGLLLALAAPASPRQAPAGEKAGQAEGQVGTAKTAAPVNLSEHLESAPLAASTPMAEALFNQKQQLLRDHHLTVPVPEAEAPLFAPLAESATFPATLLSPLAGASTVSIVANRALKDTETNDQTSTVCEPTVAVRKTGKEILVTGNWFAAFSKNGGQNFQYLNPASTFPASPQGGFCCDQVALYDADHDVMFWLLQYIKNNSGNTLRLAVAKGEDIPNQQWRYYDFSPQSVGNWAQEWFDFPDLVLSKQNLYVTSNSFSTQGDPNNPFKRSVVLRLPLTQLANYQALNFNYFSDNRFSPRATHGAVGTMYWACHENTASLRVYTWPETGTAVTQKSVGVQAWTNQVRQAPGPDGRNWLRRADPRITAAWTSGNTIGFAWSSSQGGSFAFPHVRVAMLNKDTQAAVAQPHLWSNNLAYAYPAAAPNSGGRLGLSVHFGGGTNFPSHAVGAFVPAAGGQPAKWDLIATIIGNSGPVEDNKWGDYMAVRPHGQNPATWVTAGFALKGGPQAKDIQVNYIQFK